MNEQKNERDQVKKKMMFKLNDTQKIMKFE